ncbi:MAG: M3 family metallopeptidase [Candidatus Gracilibacteria bacterium]|nr:M3 family metallopeptidase [Candidatus Gracilibacteria bacterium]
MCEFLTTKEATTLLKLGENPTNNITDMTKEQVEDLTSVKARILGEINKAGFPDLEFLFSPEALEQIPALLDELLEEEKAIFQRLIAKNPEDVVFDDLIEETSVHYLFGLVKHLNSVEKSDFTKSIIENFEEKYIAFNDDKNYSNSVYEIFKYLLEKGGFDPSQIRILEKNIRTFEINGINLPLEKQEKIRKINIKLGKLENDFDNNIIDSENAFSYLVTDIEIIKDLPETTLEIAAKNAKENLQEGYLFDANPTAYSNIMDYCSDSKLREYFLKARLQFASSGECDNRPIILKILKLKQEKAKLLGYKNYAEFNLVEEMADSPEQVFELIGLINEKAKEKAKKEIENLKSYFGLEKIEYWDVSFYERKFKEEKYNIDEKEIKKYLKYENVLSYLFEQAKNFYGVEIKKINAKVYNDDVEVYEAWKNGKLISYYFTDIFHKKGKAQGAWAENIRLKNEIAGNMKIPVIANVCNYQKNETGEILLTVEDAETLFHEFGHTLHEMLSEGKYSELSGFRVEMDFVELPSQLNENFVKDKASFANLAKHYLTGEKLSDDILDKIEELKILNSGMLVLGQNAYALLDMKLHYMKAPKTIEELDNIVLSILNDIAISPKGPEYKIHASFRHIFAGPYDAKYYSYMWAELLEADVFARIKEMGMFDREVGEKFISTILGQGTRKPANELFRDFMGRDLDNTAFMKRKGLL